jgi:hypothetical protein
MPNHNQAKGRTHPSGDKPLARRTMGQGLFCIRGIGHDDRPGRDHIYGPKADGTYIVGVKAATDEAWAISIPERRPG